MNHIILLGLIISGSLIGMEPICEEGQATSLTIPLDPYYSSLFFNNGQPLPTMNDDTGNRYVYHPLLQGFVPVLRFCPFYFNQDSLQNPTSSSSSNSITREGEEKTYTLCNQWNQLKEFFPQAYNKNKNFFTNGRPQRNLYFLVHNQGWSIEDKQAAYFFGSLAQLLLHEQESLEKVKAGAAYAIKATKSGLLNSQDKEFLNELKRWSEMHGSFPIPQKTHSRSIKY